MFSMLSYKLVRTCTNFKLYLTLLLHIFLVKPWAYTEWYLEKLYDLLERFGKYCVDVAEHIALSVWINQVVL